jgi:hypothetical protein
MNQIRPSAVWTFCAWAESHPSLASENSRKPWNLVRLCLPSTLVRQVAVRTSHGSVGSGLCSLSVTGRCAPPSPPSGKESDLRPAKEQVRRRLLSTRLAHLSVCAQLWLAGSLCCSTCPLMDQSDFVFPFGEPLGTDPSVRLPYGASLTSRIASIYTSLSRSRHFLMNCQAVERVAIDRCDQLLVFAVHHSVMCPKATTSYCAGSRNNDACSTPYETFILRVFGVNSYLLSLNPTIQCVPCTYSGVLHTYIRVIPDQIGYG